jgi:hypothetical protein
MDHHKALLAFFLVARRLLSLSEFLSSRARPIEESRPRTRSNAESLTPSFARGAPRPPAACSFRGGGAVPRSSSATNL